MIPNPRNRSMAEPKFEQALKRLEQIVDSLEGGTLSLEESLKVFEEGGQTCAPVHEETGGSGAQGGGPHDRRRGEEDCSAVWRNGGRRGVRRGEGDLTAVDLAPYLETCRRRVDRQLDRVPSPEGAFPDVLHRAMRYSTLAGGKRVRAALAIASAEACGRDDDAVLPAAAALELIHAYSLIHDDLPAMDDDDIRRGRPTNHKVFGEAMAILAGDALLTLAFHVLADDGLNPNLGAPDRIRVIQEIGRAAGHGGLVGGQAVDVASEGLHADMAVLEYIHTHKTGALIRAAVRAGAIVGGAGRPISRPSPASARRSALPFRSPTICWTSKEIRRSWERASAATTGSRSRLTRASSAWSSLGDSRRSSSRRPSRTSIGSADGPGRSGRWPGSSLSESASVVSHKSIYFVCHSGLDGACPALDAWESSLLALDSRFRGNDISLSM